jgi:hypothetical protein
LSGAFTKTGFVTPDMWCCACGKTARGPVQPGWIDLVIRDKETGENDYRAVCGQKCMEIWLTKETKIVIDPTKPELDALMQAGYAAGEYLESIRKTDLATLSEGEWTTFLGVVISKYQDESIPF